MNLKPKQIYIPVEGQFSDYSLCTHQSGGGWYFLTDLEPQTKIILSEEELKNLLKDYGLFVLTREDATADNFINQLKEK